MQAEDTTRHGRSVAAVLVAGGHGRRAGGPKAIKPWRGTVMWRWQVAALTAAGCAPVVAVLHPAAWSAPRPASVEIGGDLNGHLRADPDATMLASLQRGLRACLGRGHDGAVFLLPVDCPCPSVGVFDALTERAQSLQNQGISWSVLRPWVQLAEGPRRGHPVLLGSALVARVLAADPAAGRLDRLIDALAAAERVDVAVTDPTIRSNLNVAEAWSPRP